MVRRDVEETRQTPQWTLADRLVKARTFANMTQQEMADALEVHRNTVSSYEIGKLIPRSAIVRAWADLTSVSFEWLAGSAEKKAGASLEKPARRARRNLPTGRFSTMPVVAGFHLLGRVA